MKKSYSLKRIVLALCLAATIPVTSSAAVGDQFTNGSMTYKVLNENNEVAMIKSSSMSGENVPASVEDNGVTYKVTAIGDGTNSAFNNTGGAVVIAEGITTIKVKAFENSRVNTISLPNSLTTLEERAFQYTNSLTVLVIPDGVKEILGWCFMGSAVTEITFGSGITSIGTSATLNCNKLTAIKFKATTPPTLASNSFAATLAGKITVYVPVGCKTAYETAWSSYGFAGFEEDESLGSGTSPEPTPEPMPEGSEFEVDGSKYKVLDGNNNVAMISNSTSTQGTESLTIPGSVEYQDVTYNVTTIGDGSNKAFNNAKIVVLGEGITTIKQKAFNSSQVNTLTLPESLTTLETRSLQMAQFKTLVIPDAVKEIPDYCMMGNAALTEITFGAGIEKIGAGATTSCSSLTTIKFKATTPPTLESNSFAANLAGKITVYVPKNCKGAYETAWKDYGFKEYIEDETLGVGEAEEPEPGDVSEFGVDGLKYSVLEGGKNEVAMIGNTNEGTIVVPGTVTYNNVQYKVTTIGNGSAVFDDNDTSVTLEEGITTIRSQAFALSNVTKIKLPNSLTTLESNAFSACAGIETLTIPDGVSEITMGCFMNCKALQEIIFGSGVKKLNSSIIYNCTALTAIKFKTSTPPESSTSTFDKAVQPNVTVYVPKGCLEAYELAWGTYQFSFKDIVEWDAEAVEEPDADDFIVDGLKYKVLENKDVALVGNGYNVSEISVPAKVTYENVDYNVTTIGDGNAVFNSTNIKKVTLAEGITTIKTRAFSNGNKEVILPSTLTTLETESFYLTNLDSLIIPDNVEVIPEKCFSSNVQLKKITFGSKVKSIGSETFLSYYNLAAINIATATPPTLGTQIFGVEYGEGYAPMTTVVTVPKGSKAAYEEAWGTQYKFKAIVEEGEGGGSVDPEPEPEAEFSVGGSTYRILEGDNNEVALIRSSDYSEVGDPITVAATVEYEGITYNVTTVGDGEERVFDRTTGVILSEGFTTIRSNAFNGTNVNMLSMPVTLTTLEDGALRMAQFTSLEFPDKVEAIPANCFRNNTQLTEVIFGFEVKSIGANAAAVCNKLVTIKFKTSTPPTLDETSFANRGEITVYVPTGSKETYETAWEAYGFKEFVEFDPGEPDPEPPVGIYEIEVDAITYVVTADGIQLSANVDEMAAIYTLSGQVLTSGRCIDGFIPARLTAGIYLLRIGDTTLKVLVK